ncbi:hypothetical protein GBZ26_19200 [Azospirillum formosense]|uniref:Uncharacterized protein n=1 Tax=Azospirillum formosense TaxID=861533 RepID=A0ABX2L028_9PROT|nr:hypothetical protein [Azospirillum formosense]MBY3752049.1 hypothetical protein [Azospirillum formosense]NUB21312.1 hypothetical protein [Azospirillum formosense]
MPFPARAATTQPAASQKGGAFGKPLGPSLTQPNPPPSWIGFALVKDGVNALKQSIMDRLATRAARQGYRIPSEDEIEAGIRSFQDALNRQSAETVVKSKKNQI